MVTLKESLSIIDYILITIMLLISSGIGVYFKFSGDKQKTTKEYFFAGKDMSVWPVAFSLMASYLSATTIVGVPAEMYHFGIYMVYLNVTYTIGMAVAMFVTLPVFFEMQASTAYEYLEVRFGKCTRTMASFAFLVQMILFMSVVLYAPALALSAVTNLAVWVSIVSIGVVCTFYCTIGGMKAVLWTDVFQSILMFTGVFAVIIVGFMGIGFEKVFAIANEGGRIVVPDFDFSPYKRYTAWNIIIQGIVLSMSSYGVGQVQIQRLLTVRNLKRARWALILNMPLTSCFHLLTCVAGLIIYAYFHLCDPMTPPNNPIKKGDQLLPYFMMISLNDYPGLPGLCICGIFSASLSTISSAINSLTAVAMQDLVRPLLESKDISQTKMTLAAQAITLFFGAICIGLTFVVASFGNLVQACMTVFGMLGGPILGLFLLGMFTLRGNQKGAVIGLIAGILISGWIGFGSSANGPRPKILPSSTDGCQLFNSSIDPTFFSYSALPRSIMNSEVKFSNASQFVTENTVKIVKRQGTKEEDIFPLYRISYMWLTPIGFTVSFIVGYIASIVVRLITGERTDVSEKLISPVMKWCYFRKSQSKMDDIIKVPPEYNMETTLNSVTMKVEENMKRYITDFSSH